MITHEYRNQVLAEIEAAGISLELFEEKVAGTDSPDKSRIGEIVRMYITSLPLGGTLAVNHGEGWFPTFPEKPNYPIQGKWYSPALRKIYAAKQSWHDAVIDALMPERLSCQDRLDREVALYCVKRAQKLRHPLQAAAAVAILTKMKEDFKVAACRG